MVTANLESLTDKQIQELTSEQLGDQIENTLIRIQQYCGRDSEKCNHYHEQIKRYWMEEHRRKA